MINRVKSLINEFRNYNKDILLRLEILENRFLELELQSKELEWAHIYHDSINEYPHIKELGLNIGRWAGNYSFFYVLQRILADIKPLSILEFGMGESTKFISAFISNHIQECNHVVIEQDLNWITSFKSRFELSKQSKIIHCPLESKTVKGHEVNSYSNLESSVNDKFNFYVVDGPFGSPRYSRYEIVSIASRFDLTHDFVILFDDTNRIGEQDTLDDILNVLDSKRFKFYTNHYIGKKRVTVICSEKYRHLASL